MSEDEKIIKRLYIWIGLAVFVAVFVLVLTLSFATGFRQGQINMAETGFAILDHLQIKEVNMDINETELMNTMIDRFEKDYNLNLTEVNITK